MGRLGWLALAAAGVAAIAVGALAAVVTDDEGSAEPAPVYEEGPEPPGLPTGTLTATSAGPVTVGMTRAQVLEHFTPPAERVAVNLSSGGPAPQENWVWHLPGGDFTVHFDNRAGEVAGFFVAAPQFETETGVRVGDPLGPVQEAFSEQLRLSPLGQGGYILSPGQPGSFPALVFSAPEGVIEMIGAGLPGAAGE